MAIFSGDESKELWRLINRLGKAKTKRRRKRALRAAWDALYLLGCKFQEFEGRVARLEADAAKGKNP